MGGNQPPGFLKCDGSTYQISAYPDLSNYFYNQFGSVKYFGGNGTTTFAVPNLQGEFLRGAGTNSHANQGSGGSVGEHQDGTGTNYVGVGSQSLFAENNNTGISSYDSILHDSAGYNTYYASSTTASGGGTWSGCSFTSRPTNTSVLYIIKAYYNLF